MITNSVKVPENEVSVFKYKKEYGIIGGMDCGGSNLMKINEQIPGIVKIIITTRTHHEEVKARQRANELKLPLVELDFRRYEEEKGVFHGDYFKALQIREFESKVKEIGDEKVNAKSFERVYYSARIRDLRDKIKSKLPLEKIIEVRNDVCNIFRDMIYEKMKNNGINPNIPMFAAGIMALFSEDFVSVSKGGFDIENVHPGDVTKYDLEGNLRHRRMIVGDGWIPPAKAISAGHDFLYSSFHKMIYEMDAGPIYMRGYGLPIDYNFLLSKVNIKDKEILKQIGGIAQETLKYIGDHVIAGATFQDMFNGKWGYHKSGVLAYKFDDEWYLAPNGIMIEDHVANNPNTVFKRDESFIKNKIKEFYANINKISKQNKSKSL